MNQITVPIANLVPSPQNVRRTGGRAIAELAANIRSVDLLHNLVVRAADGERFEVVDGHRRLAALQRLVDDEHLPVDFRVPCRVIGNTSDEGATEASLSANTMSEAMHPADQFEAFRKLVAGGMPLPDVAAHFGVTDLVVERRLRLANVAPELLEAFRANKLTLELMMAFAITDDHAAQLRVWNEESTRVYGPINANIVRRRLAQSDIPTSDRRVQLIGLARYEAAGGVVRRDLFDDAGGGYVLDVALLDSLVDEVLQEKAAELAAEGWAFVKVLASDTASNFVYGCNRSQAKRVPRELTEVEAHRLEELQQRHAAIGRTIDDAGDDDSDGHDEDRYDALHAEHDAIADEIKSLTDAPEIYTERQKAKAGAIVTLDYHNGSLRIERGLIPREGGKAAKAVASDKGEKPAPKEPTLAESMLRRLSAHRTVALQAGLMASAPVALAALAHALLGPLLEPAAPSESALNVRAELMLDQPAKFGFEDVEQHPTFARTREAIAELRRTLNVPTRRAELLPWLLQQKQEVVVSLLASTAVMTVNAIQHVEGKHPADALVVALDLDMADYWQPTAATFFTLVPRALAQQALTDALGGDQAGTLEASAAGMKKAEFAGFCESHMARTGWLPKPLRRPGYQLRGGPKATTKKAVAAAPAPGKKAPKPAAKKAAKKAVTTSSAKRAAKATKKAPAKRKGGRK
jgi:ParB family chromosome partitioning protein